MKVPVVYGRSIVKETRKFEISIANNARYSQSDPNMTIDFVCNRVHSSSTEEQRTRADRIRVRECRYQTSSLKDNEETRTFVPSTRIRVRESYDRSQKIPEKDKQIDRVTTKRIHSP